MKIKIRFLSSRRGMETVTAVFMLLIMFTVITLIVTVYTNYNDSEQKQMNDNQQRSQEQIVLTKSIDFQTDTIRSITLSNTGTIESKISAFYITRPGEETLFIDPSTKNIQKYIEPGKSITIDANVFGSNIASSTKIIASTERGVRTADGPLPTVTPTPLKIPDPDRYRYGPVELKFSSFWGKGFDGKSFNPHGNWPAGWVVDKPNSDLQYYAWKIEVTNIATTEIVLDGNSSFTTVSSENNNPISWYLYTDSQYDGHLVPNVLTTLVFVYAQPGSSSFKDIYPSSCTCQVFLTFFGKYSNDAPYGQTIPFEAAIKVI